MKKPVRYLIPVLLLITAGLITFESCKRDNMNPDKPVVTFNSPFVPSGGGTILRNILIQVNAQAAEGKSIEKVEFFIDGVLMPNGVDTELPFECAYEETSVFGPVREIKAVATDDQGFSESAILSVRFFNAVEVSPMPTDRYGFVTEAVNGKIYVIGGTGAFSQVVEEYDPATDTWTTKASPAFGHGAAASCVINNLIYVFGGGDLSGWHNNVEAYDPATNTWTSKASIPMDSGGAVGLTTATLCNGKVYLIGGEATTDPARIVEYDPVNDTWALRNEYKGGYNAFAVELNNTIFYFGGCSYNTMGFCVTGSVSMQTYETNTSTWTTHSPMPSVHTGHTAAVIYPNIYVFGGTQNNATLTNCDVDRYNAATDTWTSLAPMPHGAVNFGCAAVNGKIYIIDEYHVYEYTPD